MDCSCMDPAPHLHTYAGLFGGWNLRIIATFQSIFRRGGVFHTAYLHRPLRVILLELGNLETNGEACIFECNE